MVEDNFDEELETKPKKTAKKKKTKKKTSKVAKEAKTIKVSKSQDDKNVNNDNNLFVIIVVAVIILGIIGILFGYTKDKITKMSNDKEEISKTLGGQLTSMKEELGNLKEKADVLEKENIENKEAFINLFDRNREIPKKLDIAEWSTVESEELSFLISYPKEWEIIKPIINIKTVDDVEQKEEILYLQPLNVPTFINAVTIKTDYSDFASLTLEEKEEIFAELNAIDTYEFDKGLMIYFINVDKNEQEVPTILVLTEDNIYRATYNVVDKKLDNYFDYREDFEKIVASFGMRPELIEEDAE